MKPRYLFLCILLSIVYLSMPFVCLSATSDYAGAPQPLVDDFLQHYDSLLQDGSVDAQAKEQAESLWRQLRKYLMAIQAQLDGIQLDIQEQTGEAQQQAIRQLSRTTAEREREIMRYLSQIQVLAGILPAEKASAPVSPAPMLSVGGKPVFGMKMEGEDLVNDPPSLE